MLISKEDKAERDFKQATGFVENKWGLLHNFLRQGK